MSHTLKGGEIVKCEFLRINVPIALDIKPDFNKMKEVEISKKCFEKIRRRRKGLTELKLYFTSECYGILFIYKTIAGEFAMPCFGRPEYCNNEKFIVNTASSPVVDKFFPAIYNIDDAKIVDPISFFDNYRYHCKRGKTSTMALF